MREASVSPEILSVAATTHGRVLVRRARSSTSKGVLAGFHGYAENAATQMERLDRIPGAGDWTLVSIQGLHRFYRGRSQDVVASWMTREDRETAIADNIQYVDAAIAAIDEPPASVIYAGFSQGVAMAFRAAVHAKRAAAGIIGVGGDVPPDLLSDASLTFPRVLLARGTRDEWYTAAKLAADVVALRNRGVDVREVTYDGGHEWTAEADQAAAIWLQA